MNPSFLHRIGPALGRRTRFATLRACAITTLGIICVGSPSAARADFPDFPSLNPFAKAPEPGTPEWWKKHQYTDATFEAGKGYSVPGVDGYYDDRGRRLDRPPANGAEPIPTPRLDGKDAEEETGLLPGLDPRVAYGKVKTAVGLGPNDQAAHKLFLEGEGYFQEKYYKKAAKKYEEAADRAVDMRLKEDSMFMAAESYFFDDRYIPARDAYNALADKYPSTRYLDKLIDREWAIAQYWEHYEEHSPDWTGTPNGWDKTRPWFDTIGHAIKTYDNIRMNDPTGPRADDAIMATAGIYFREGKYEDADYHYTLLRREYPRSEFQFEAHLLGLQSKLRKYQGEDYDGTPLEEAQQLVTQLRRNFANQLSPEERDRLKVVSAQLTEQQATRTMRMAQYYDGTKHYGAAKGYYAEVIKKYPDTDLAKTARDRVAVIASEPDAPAKRLAWVVEAFPKSKEHAALAKVPEIKNGTLIARAQAPADDTQTAAQGSPTTTK
jgi:outer membrane protein assembly factor BamD (BamD/ComL family)